MSANTDELREYLDALSIKWYAPRPELGEGAPYKRTMCFLSDYRVKFIEISKGHFIISCCSEGNKTLADCINVIKHMKEVFE